MWYSLNMEFEYFREVAIPTFKSQRALVEWMLQVARPSHKPSINANELRDLSVHHFSQKGADIRSLQSLRQSKQLRRLQSLNETDFNQLQKKFKNKHLRNTVIKEE